MDIAELLAEMQQGPLQSWAEQLPTQIAKGMNIKRYGDLPRWQAALTALPQVSPSSIDLNTGCLRVGDAKDVNTTLQHQIETTLRQLHPWRKGPYDVFGIHVDTEWRSDWKWERLKDHIQPLAGRRVLDVGCGNGYHCWRMYAAGAKQVIGIDPTPLFIMQFQALKHFIGQAPVYVLPLGIDDVPPQLEAFDTVFSMGVLYHRRSPVDHILQLRDCLKPGGELVLETLVIDGDENRAVGVLVHRADDAPRQVPGRKQRYGFIVSVEENSVSERAQIKAPGLSIGQTGHPNARQLMPRRLQVQRLVFENEEPIAGGDVQPAVVVAMDRPSAE